MQVRALQVPAVSVTACPDGHAACPKLCGFSAPWHGPAGDERGAPARRRIALRLLVELLRVGVSQDAPGLLEVVRALVRAPPQSRAPHTRSSHVLPAAHFPGAAA